MIVGRSTGAIACLAVAFLFSGAARAECPTFPTTASWGNLSHDRAIRYVANMHDGDWSPYVKKWKRQLASLEKIQAKGGTVVFKKKDLRLKGEALDDYVFKVKERVMVNNCLAEEDEIRTAEAEAKELENFSTAAGTPDTEFVVNAATEQLSQARAAFKSAYKAFRAGNRDGLDVAMQRLREVLGE